MSMKIKFYISMIFIISLTLIAIGATVGYMENRINRYVYEMHGEVTMESAEQFRKFIKDKSYNDVVDMHIESVGGLVISGNKIQYYMNSTLATIKCTVDSHAASAAAMILMQCDEIFVIPSAKILFHMYQMCANRTVFGCTKYEPVTLEKYPLIYFRSVMALQSVRHLLTEVEWKAMIKGEDITLDGDEFMERLKRSQ